MLYRGKHDICGYHLNAGDGDVGKIKDIYFDDLSWTIRYLVVDTGTWLNGRRVLIAPEALTGFSDDAGVFTTALTQKQIEDSPAPDSDLPVSKQFEERLQLHYGWNSYWGSIYPMAGMYAYPMAVLTPKVQVQKENHGDMHLRSLREVTGYEIQANDGSIGEIEDVLVEPETWRITHFIADTSKWWFGNRVVIDKGSIVAISWKEKRIEMDLSREEIKSSPAYQPGMAIDEAYQSVISEYYAQTAKEPRAGRGTGVARDLTGQSHPDI